MPAYHSWEYYVFDMDPDDDDLEKELNKIGKDGWNMCGIFPTDCIIIFKRASDGILPYTGSGTRRKRPDRKTKDSDDQPMIEHAPPDKW